MKLTIVNTLTLASLLTIPLPLAMVVTSASPAFAASALQTLDPDKDGTVDLNEAKTAAGALFDQLDVDLGHLDHAPSVRSDERRGVTHRRARSVDRPSI